MLPTSADPTGITIAQRYVCVRALGAGAFGRTFLARDTATQREVAVKLLDPAAAGDWKAVELFEREALVLRSLRHHGIPEVHAVVKDQWNGAPAMFLVMDYVEGVSLAQMISEQRPLEPAEVMRIFLDLLGIVEYLHGRVPPILHRDIKPSNIIVRSDGSPSLVDFGSVRRVFLAPDESGSTVVGTYGYMPYEQYMGQATPASDLYALGATFLHLLTGRAPREFMTDEGRIEVPATLPGNERLRAVIAKLLQPSPAARFASADEVRRALLSSVSVALTTVAEPPKPVRSAASLPMLPVTPRAIDGDLKALLDRACPTAFELMDTSAKPGDKGGFGEVALFVFFSILTAGILPLVFVSMARSRRRQLTRFLREGLPATAEVLSIQLVPTAFEQKIAKVSYEFEADGTVHRDADQVLPRIADRWRVGDRVQVLYLPELEYSSVIVPV